MLILNGTQAAALTGPTGLGAALNPVPLVTGDAWVLPAAVLLDPMHALVVERLSALPKRYVLHTELPQPVNEEG